MKVIDIIKGEKPGLSFEVFPPKLSANFDVVMAVTSEIAKYIHSRNTKRR